MPGLASLRKTVRDAGLNTSFPGATEEALEQALAMQAHGTTVNLPALPKAKAINHLTQRYDALIESTSLKALASLFPEEDWNSFMVKGWAALSLSLNADELNMFGIVHRTLLAELGINPCDVTTYPGDGKHCAHYEATFGWLRQPALSASQAYLTTHPRVRAVAPRELGVLPARPTPPPYTPRSSTPCRG
jgi:hypothetical protein